MGEVEREGKWLKMKREGRRDGRGRKKGGVQREKANGNVGV